MLTSAFEMSLFHVPGVNGYPKTILHAILDNADKLPDVFFTLLVLIRDNRLRGPLLRYLRTTQFFVKYYVNCFPDPDMEPEAVGHFLKCLSIELKFSQQVGPIAHVLVNEESNKFLNILDNVEVVQKEAEIPDLEFFENELVMEVRQM